MAKFIIAFNAVPGITRKQCLEHYEHNHAELVTSTTEFSRHVHAYTQNFSLEEIDKKSNFHPVDGISELWFKDWDIYTKAFSEPRYLENIRPDEGRFADLDSVLVVFSSDYVVYKNKNTPAFKYFRFLKKNKNVAEQEFLKIWNIDFAGMIKNHSAITSLANSYIQNSTAVFDKNPFPMSNVLNGVDEYWLDDPDAAEELYKEQIKITEESGLGRLIDKDSVRHVICQSKIIIDNNKPVT